MFKSVGGLLGRNSILLPQTRQYAEKPSIKLDKVLVLSKLSRYDFERKQNPDLSEKQLENKLKNRGSDYNLLLYHHYVHKGIENSVKSTFMAAGIETKVVTRLDYTDDNIHWSDAVVTTGGDGTYLLAATRIRDYDKPLIGFNSDPIRSKGQLCLPKKYSLDVKQALDKLLAGKFKWTFRNRIRVTLVGEDIHHPPVELHKQKLQTPENRYLDIDRDLYHKIPNPDAKVGQRTLPFLALNEVFIGECISARVSYLEFGFDTKPPFKQKCSGFIASTGTGSTSWTYSINKLTEQNLEDILSITREETNLPIPDNKNFTRKIADKFNETLIIDPGEQRMVYAIRDMLHASPLLRSSVKPRGLIRKLTVKSRCFDASLVIDGGVSYRFNDGSKAILEILSEDALRTVTLDDQPSEVSYKH